MLLYRLYVFITFPIRWLSLNLRNKENNFIFHERMGRPTENRPSGNLAWVHARNLRDAAETARGIMANMPGAAVLVTYRTRAAGDDFHIPGAVCQFSPIDDPTAFRNFLRFWEPSVAIYLGSELFPIQLSMLRKAGIPSFLVNAQISDRAYRRWKLIKWVARKTVRNFMFVWTVDNKQTIRFANMGASDIKSQELLQGPGKMREIMFAIKRALK